MAPPPYKQIGNFGRPDLPSVIPSKILFSLVQNKYYVISGLDPAITSWSPFTYTLIDSIDMSALYDWQVSFSACLSPDESTLYVGGRNMSPGPGLSGFGVYAIDLATMTLVNELFFPAGFSYDSVVDVEISPDNAVLYAIDSRSGITQVDVATFLMVSRFTIGTVGFTDKVRSVITPDGSKIYITLGTSQTVDTRPGKIAVVDTATFSLSSLTTLSTLTFEPWLVDLVITADGSTLYATDANNGVITEIDTGTIADTVFYTLPASEASLWIKFNTDETFLLFQDSFSGSDVVYVLEIVGPALQQAVAALSNGFGLDAFQAPDEIHIYILDYDAGDGEVSVLGPISGGPMMYRMPS